MINERARAYTEVYTILKMMDPQYLDKVPKKFKNIIIEEMDKEYHPKIVSDISLKNQNLNPKTYTILSILNLNYWCVNQEHKDELLKIYSENEKIKEKKIREQYNPDNIFKNETDNVSNYALTEYKESIFKRILDKIRNFFIKFK